MNGSSVLVRVNTLRSSAGGGTIFAGVEVDAKGGRIDAKQHLVVRAAHWMIQTPVEPGQVWRVSGKSEQNTIIVNGYRLTENTLTAEHLELIRPSGEHIVTLLAHSKAFIVRAYPLQTHEMLFNAMTQAFRVLGGVPRCRRHGTGGCGIQCPAAPLSPAAPCCAAPSGLH